MKYQVPKTLSYFDSLPQLKAVDLSSVPVRSVAEATKKYRNSSSEAHPDSEAVDFYGLNHCAMLVRSKFTKNEILPDWAVQVMEAYSREVVQQSQRMMHYLLSIVTREMRHIKDPTTAAIYSTIQSLYPEMGSFLKKIKALNEDQAVSAYMNQSPVGVSLGTYVAAMSHAFHNGSWSHGFGGKAWGKVADALYAMVKGNTSLEMMVDTAYTLAHNNGPIFNKGMLYKHYSGSFIMLLDVQRSGQIPELLRDSTIWAAAEAYGGTAKQVVSLVKSNVPDAFGDLVDWQKVMDQIPKHELDNQYRYKTQLEKQKKLNPSKVVSLFNGKPAEIIGTFQVMPSVSVNMYKRKVA